MDNPSKEAREHMKKLSEHMCALMWNFSLLDIESTLSKSCEKVGVHAYCCM
jgi:hypothetical protein